MINYERGNIILVPFPFSDQSTTKKRPAVVISSDDYNENSPDIIIMAITSRIEQAFYMGECFIENWQDAGLLRPSSTKPAISTIEKSLILKKLGRLSPRDLIAIDKVLKKLINI